jgi:polygalacturonase
MKLKLFLNSIIVAACLIAFLAPSTARAADEAPIPDIPRPQIPHNTFKITDFGAVGDGTTMNTDAITKAIAACSKAGGGVVLIPDGKFLSGPLALASSTELHLEKNATLLFPDKSDDFPVNEERYSNELSAADCHDVAITGEGTIDGQGKKWWQEFLKSKKMPHRPFMVVMHNCTRVLVQGVTLTNSPMFHLVPGACTDVVIDGIHIIAPEKAPNTDGIDPSGWNYLITHCTFDTGDDCIAIKPTGAAPPGHVSCENFFITDCSFVHGHGMSIGGQTPGGLRHLTVRDCTFESTDAGIRMKAARGSGGLVEDCLYENLTMKDVKMAIDISSYYPNKDTPASPQADPEQPVGATTPIWRNIKIQNVTAIGSHNIGRIIGLPEMPVSDIELDNVNISGKDPFQIWNAKDIHFVNSNLSASAHGAAMDIEHSSDVIGIDPQTGKSK